MCTTVPRWAHPTIIAPWTLAHIWYPSSMHTQVFSTSRFTVYSWRCQRPGNETIEMYASGRRYCYETLLHHATPLHSGYLTLHEVSINSKFPDLLKGCAIASQYRGYWVAAWNDHALGFRDVESQMVSWDPIWDGVNILLQSTQVLRIVNNTIEQHVTAYNINFEFRVSSKMPLT